MKPPGALTVHALPKEWTVRHVRLRVISNGLSHFYKNVKIVLRTVL